MPESEPEAEIEAAVLLADITGSTPLYREVGDAEAARRVGLCLDRLRTIVSQEGGRSVRTKGDDVLCLFDDPMGAFRAVRAMLLQTGSDNLGIHAGLHFGPLVQARDDIFGDTVNMTARLAALANPGEALISRSVVGRLPQNDTVALRLLDHITFKGSHAPTEVFSLQVDDAGERTKAAFGHGSGHTRTKHQRIVPNVTLTLRHGDHAITCHENQSLTFGRASDCDILIPRPWISRQHATIAIRRGKVQIDDRSSSGTYVVMRDGYEFFMRRESVLLTGSGIISPVLRPSDVKAEPIHYKIVRET